MRNLIVPSPMFFMSCSFIPDDAGKVREIRSDFNNDHKEDYVRILPPPTGGEYYVLEISLSGEKERITSHSLISASAYPGVSLELKGEKDFKVLIDQATSYREYTVTYDQGKFLVSDFLMSNHDQADPEIGGTCEVNLLKGEGETNFTPVKFPRVKREFASVDETWTPEDCDF